MNKLQTVYIPIKTEDELPKNSCKCGIIKKGEFDLSYFIKAPSYELFDHVRSGLSHNQSEITHWLKPTEAYVFTPEELKQLLEEYTNRIVENGKCLHIGYGGYTINKKSITSQLHKFLKEKGI
jgi:hypothetical protein